MVYNKGLWLVLKKGWCCCVACTVTTQLPGLSFICFLHVRSCVHFSPIFVTLSLSLNWVKGAFRRAGELFKSCVWVLVCVCGLVGGARNRFTPHVQEIWRPFPRQLISLFSVFHWLELVQFNFFRAHRLVLSPLYPFFSPPMGETYFPLSLTPWLSAHIIFCLTAKCCFFIFPVAFVPYSWDI